MDLIFILFFLEGILILAFGTIYSLINISIGYVEKGIKGFFYALIGLLLIMCVSFILIYGDPYFSIYFNSLLLKSKKGVKTEFKKLCRTTCRVN